MVAQQRSLQMGKAEEERGFRGLWWKELARTERDWVIADPFFLSQSVSLSSLKENQLISKLEPDKLENMVSQRLQA